MMKAIVPRDLEEELLEDIPEWVSVKKSSLVPSGKIILMGPGDRISVLKVEKKEEEDAC